jgi:hypothetical protein
VPSVPDELAAVIGRLMEKEPAARFPTAEALRRECERLRLVAEHGPALEVKRGSRSQLALGLVLLVVVGASAAWYFTQTPNGGPAAQTPRETREDLPAQAPDDASFFAGKAGPSANDEEELLRAREREASQALRELPPFLSDEERVAALERIRARYSGTAAAANAATEIAALRSTPGASAAPAAALDAADQDLRRSLEPLVQRGAPLSEELRGIDAFRPPPELGPEFEARRAAFERERIAAAEGRMAEAFAKADQLALDGKFAVLRAHLEALAPALAGLDELPGDPARLAAARKLHGEVGERRARVDEQERFFLADVERRARRDLGEALGPGSGPAGRARRARPRRGRAASGSAPAGAARARPRARAGARDGPRAHRAGCAPERVRRRRLAPQVAGRPALEEGARGARRARGRARVRQGRCARERRLARGEERSGVVVPALPGAPRARLERGRGARDLRAPAPGRRGRAGPSWRAR